MSGKDEVLQKLLEDLKLGKYYAKFLEEETLYCDLENISEEELLPIIPKSIHRKRLLTFLESQKETKNEGNAKGAVEEKKEGTQHVRMKVKFRNEVKDIEDIPLGTNEELIGKLLQTFLECELKLPDKTVLRKEMMITLGKWLESTVRSPESEIRGVLSVKGKGVLSGGGGGGEETERLKIRVKELENKLERVEKERDRKTSSLEKKVESLQIQKLELAQNFLWGLNWKRVDYYVPNKLYSEIVNSGGKLDGNANFNLGYMYDNGYGVKKDKKRANEFFKKAADFYSSKKVKELKPIDWKNMGRMYVHGHGFKENTKKGIELLKKAVERGNELAMLHLGYCYKSGIGVEKSYSEAIKLYANGAEMGLPGAIYNLGFAYDNGWGVKKDEKKAFALRLESAEKGERNAMHWVGNHYKMGIGVEENLEEAKKWFKRAAELGDIGAIKKLERLSS